MEALALSPHAARLLAVTALVVLCWPCHQTLILQHVQHMCSVLAHVCWVGVVLGQHCCGVFLSGHVTVPYKVTACDTDTKWVHCHHDTSLHQGLLSETFDRVLGLLGGAVLVQLCCAVHIKVCYKIIPNNNMSHRPELGPWPLEATRLRYAVHRVKQSTGLLGLQAGAVLIQPIASCMSRYAATPSQMTACGRDPNWMHSHLTPND